MIITIKGPKSGNAVILGNTSGTDRIIAYGLNNQIYSGGANDIITAGAGQAYVDLGGFSGVTDQVSLGGFNNRVVGALHSADLTITGGAGYSTIDLGNAGGSTTLSVGGYYNSITLNGDATNSVSAGIGLDSVQIGKAGDRLFASSSIVTLGGTANSVTAGDEAVSVSGGQGTDTITLGNGHDTVSESGTGNHITVGWGSDRITAGSGSDSVLIAAGPPAGQSSSDRVFLAGGNNSVAGGNEAIAVTDATGHHDHVTLGNGSDTVSLTGGHNTITLGNGNDTITATGSSNTITAGSGTDHVAIGGSDVLTLLGSAAGSTVGIAGTQDRIFLSQNAGATLSETISAGLYLQIDATGGTNGGKVVLSGFAQDLTAGVVDLHGFTQYQTFTEVAAHLHSDLHGGQILALGTGSIDFLGVAALSAHNFSFS